MLESGRKKALRRLLCREFDELHMRVRLRIRAFVRWASPRGLDVGVCEGAHAQEGSRPP